MALSTQFVAKRNPDVRGVLRHSPRRHKKNYRNKPLQVMCYMCAREYGTKSLKIHWKTCRTKLELSIEQLPLSRKFDICDPPDETSFPFPNFARNDANEFLRYNSEALRLFSLMGLNGQTLTYEEAWEQTLASHHARMKAEQALQEPEIFSRYQHIATQTDGSFVDVKKYDELIQKEQAAHHEFMAQQAQLADMRRELETIKTNTTKQLAEKTLELESAADTKINDVEKSKLEAIAAIRNELQMEFNQREKRLQNELKDELKSAQARTEAKFKEATQANDVEMEKIKDLLNKENALEIQKMRDQQKAADASEIAAVANMREEHIAMEKETAQALREKFAQELIDAETNAAARAAAEAETAIANSQNEKSRLEDSLNQRFIQHEQFEKEKADEAVAEARSQSQAILNSHEEHASKEISSLKNEVESLQNGMLGDIAASQENEIQAKMDEYRSEKQEAAISESNAAIQKVRNHAKTVTSQLEQTAREDESRLQNLIAQRAKQILDTEKMREEEEDMLHRRESQLRADREELDLLNEEHSNLITQTRQELNAEASRAKEQYAKMTAERNEQEQEASTMLKERHQSLLNQEMALQKEHLELKMHFKHEAAMEIAQLQAQEAASRQKLQMIEAENREASVSYAAAQRLEQQALDKSKLEQENLLTKHFKKETERKRKVWLNEEKMRRKKAVRDWNQAEKQRRQNETRKANAEHKKQMAITARALAKGKHRYEAEIQNEMQAELKIQEQLLQDLLKQRTQEIQSDVHEQRSLVNAFRQELQQDLKGSEDSTAGQMLQKQLAKLKLEKEALDEARDLQIQEKLRHEQRLNTIYSEANYEASIESRLINETLAETSQLEAIKSEIGDYERILNDNMARSRIAIADAQREQASKWKSQFDDEQAALRLQAKAELASQTSRAEASAALWKERATEQEQCLKRANKALSAARSAAESVIGSDFKEHEQNLEKIFQEMKAKLNNGIPGAIYESGGKARGTASKN